MLKENRSFKCCHVVFVFSFTVGEDVDGLVVEVEEGEDGALEVEDGPVVVEDVLVELEVRRHLVPLAQPELALRPRGLPCPVR